MTKIEQQCTICGTNTGNKRRKYCDKHRKEIQISQADKVHKKLQQRYEHREHEYVVLLKNGHSMRSALLTMGFTSFNSVSGVGKWARDVRDKHKNGEVSKRATETGS